MTQSILGILFTVVLATASRAQTYSIDWHKIAGGGGTSTGGVYSVSGTIGQPDASSAMNGGNFSVSGGFWSLSVVQTVGAPALRIFLTNSNHAIIAWPAPSAGFRLQQNSTLSTTNWLSLTNIPESVGSENQITISAPIGNRYFRLSNP